MLLTKFNTIHECYGMQLNHQLVRMNIAMRILMEGIMRTRCHFGQSLSTLECNDHYWINEVKVGPL